MEDSGKYKSYPTNGMTLLAASDCGPVTAEPYLYARGVRVRVRMIGMAWSSGFGRELCPNRYASERSSQVLHSLGRMVDESSL